MSSSARRHNGLRCNSIGGFLLSQGVLCCLSQTHLDRKGGVGRKILEFFFEPLQKLIALIHKGVPGHM